MFKKIIVGVDFTEKTERAIGAALTLAKATHGTAVLLHVIPSGADSRKTTSGSDTEVMQSIEERLRDEAARLSKEHAMHVDYGVVEGAAVEEIVKFVTTWGGDCIVAATQARSGIGRILVGSVAERLLQISPVPVIVIGPEVR